jgi:AcrR family transcriptional regulator
MPLPRFERLEEPKRLQLLEIAARAFADKGFSEASLNEILAAAGLGKSSYYYYFDSKEDLYVTCLLHYLGRMKGHFVPLVDVKLNGSNFWGELQKYFLKLIVLTETHSLEMTLFRSAISLRSVLAPHFRSAAAAMMAPWIDVIRTGQKLGCVRKDLEPELLVRIAISADSALDEVYFDEGGPFTGPRLRAHALLVFDNWQRLLEARRRMPSRRRALR